MPPLARFAVLSDTHLSPAGTTDGMWNNVTCRSASAELLGAAVADIASSGIGQVILLGDVSDGGEPGMIAAALTAITGAGMRVWAVPGNHDASRSPDALTEAAAGQPDVTVLGEQQRDLGPDVAVAGHGLRSDDGGRTCEAIGVPNPAGAGRRLALVLHGHLHASVTGQAGPVLQIGVPAAVEWPNAWTEVTIEVTDDVITVATAMNRIPGSWPDPVAVIALAQPVQNWTYAAGRWAQTPDPAAR
jgi:calcineurin-like phosphoesterase family protein